MTDSIGAGGRRAGTDIAWNDRRARAEQSLVDVEVALAETEATRRQLHERLLDLGRLKQEVERMGSEAHGMVDHTLTIQAEAQRAAATVLPESGDLDNQAAVPTSGEAHWSRATVSLEQVSFEVVVDTAVGDAVSDDLALGGSVNQDLVSLMLSHIRPGDRVLDLGAHVGTFSLAAAAAGAQVLAVDASPANVAMLRAGAAANQFAHDVVVVHAAVGDAPGTVEFLPQGPWGVVVESSRPGTVTVPAVTVTELVAELRWAPLAFVKLDLEGSELRALRGMHDLLSGPDAPPLLYESHVHTLHQFGLRPADLITHLADLGYHSYLVDRPRLVRVAADDLQPHTVVDYLAVKQPPATLSVPGWQVVDHLSFDELVGRVVAECNDVDPAHRGYILGAVLAAGEPLLSNPDVRAALRAMTDDPHEAVRKLARSTFPDDGTGDKELAP